MIKINIQLFGGRGANSGNTTKGRVNEKTAPGREITVLDGKIKANEAKIEKLSRQNESIYRTTAVHDFENPKWGKFRANNKVINDLKRENSELSIQRGKIRSKAEPKQKKTFVNSYGEATKREITSSSYQRAQRRLNKEIDSRFKGR